MTTYEKRLINTGSFTSYFCEGGKGNEEAIIFLHGSGPGADAETNWKKTLNYFGKYFRVIAPDLIGFGKTVLPENTDLSFWAWIEMRVNQIIEIMDYCGIKNAHLVGNSMGGVIAQNALMLYPERFCRAILMGSGGGNTQISPTPEIIRMTRFYNNPTKNAFRNLVTWFLYDESALGDELDEIIESRYETMMRPEIKAIYPKLFSSTPFELSLPKSALRRIKHPVLLIHGYEDQFVPKESSLGLLDQLPNAELAIVKECGHWVQIEKHDKFIALTERFLQTKKQPSVI